MSDELKYYVDLGRHLVCEPYSLKNLHQMAENLDIKRCWFHKNHYDVPKQRVQEMYSKCLVVSARAIVAIINTPQDSSK